MGITVRVKVDHLALSKMLLSTPSEQSGTLLVPNVETFGTVKATVKDFIRRHLFIPDELQVLEAPLFRKLSEKDSVEDVYKRYACQADIEKPDLHVDEDTFVFFAREGGRTVELDDNVRLEEYHILDKTVLQLRRLPKSLPEEGGRIFVETKDGIIPLLAVSHETQIIELKHALERMTGIPVDQQLLSSVSRNIHDSLCIKDFDGPHSVCEDSILDLCKSGDSNVDQAHLRMVVSVNIMGEQSFTMVVQGRDLVQSILQVVESRTGVATWQQRITYSGKVLQEKKTLSDYFVRPDSTLHVTIFRSPCKPPPKMINNVVHSSENSGSGEQKPAARKIKLLRTRKGQSIGTITIPVLTTDSISDLKRKVRRTLQPLTERNFVVLRSPVGDSCDHNKVPNKSSPSPSINDQLSSSGRRLSRVLSFTGRTFASPLSSSNTSSPTIKVAIPQNGTAPGSCPPVLSSNLARADSHNKNVARTLSFKNFSGPLVGPVEQTHRPGPHAQPSAAPAPLFPPPLSSPGVSPTKKTTVGDPTLIGLSGQLTKLTSTEKVPVEDLPPPKFVMMVPNGSSHPPKSSQSSSSFVPATPRLSGGHTRAASMGHLSLNTSQLYSLPVQPPSPVEEILPHTAPISLGGYGDNRISPPKNGRVKDTSAGAEKRGLGAWLTDSMHSLKDHIKLPFAEK